MAEKHQNQAGKSLFIHNKNYLISGEVNIISLENSSSQNRENCYLLFSRLLGYPDEELYRQLEKGRHQKIWESYRQGVGGNNAKFSLIAPVRLPSLEELQQSWQQEISPENGRVRPIESLYKVWTLDDSCEMPFADSKGYLLGDWAQHLKHIYSCLNLEIPEDYQSMPDYLCLELELMSLLVRENLLERQRLFLQQHLDWIPELRKEAEEEEISGYYQEIIRFLETFLIAEDRYLKSVTPA